MACDGSGAGGALASLKAADGWRFVAAMTKPTGVEEVLSLEGLRKAEADATVRGMRENVVAAQTDAAGVGRYLQLPSARTSPRRRRRRSSSSLSWRISGLGPVAPRVHLPRRPHRRNAGGAAGGGEGRGGGRQRRTRRALGGALAQQWFEAGEPVERLLAPIRGAKARAKALLAGYLPERRAFWARDLRADRLCVAAGRQDLWRARPRISRWSGATSPSGKPLDDIPLMREIAETTVSAYESRG